MNALPILLLAVLCPLTPAAFAEPAAQAPQQRVLRNGWQIAVELEPGQRPPEDAWRPTEVPGTFEAQIDRDFDGVAWYRRSLRWEAVSGESPLFRVEFAAAATEATVYWDGREVGRHLGGWTPFSIELAAQEGALDGLLELRLDEKVGHDTQGFLTIIQPHFGGLWQDVILHRALGPTIDERRLKIHADLEGEVVRVEASILHHDPGTRRWLHVHCVREGRPVSSNVVRPVPADGVVRVEIPVASPEAWAPGRPQLYELTLELHRQAFTPPPLEESASLLHRVPRQVGFRQVDRDGTTLLWNDQPLQVRGMLHWGFSPPDFAPPVDTTRWRRDLEQVLALGCNLVKCCLWVPPRSYYEVADELGVLIWQEYPTWHAQLTRDHLPPLQDEFDEFFAHDRNHPSVAFRSITCETGADVHVEVLQTLYDRGHAAVPNSLIIDNSSWISWMRVHDFWDDHPYGNNGWWPGKIAEMKEFIAEREAMPLLLGECIASDTWFDRAAWSEAHGARAEAEDRPWYAPWCLDAQAAFEQQLSERWGDELVESLLPWSRRYALRNRKFQSERIRLDFPDAGYVLSVIRDFPKARMGFVDDLDRWKWSAEDWAWHGDTMLCLDTEGDRRAFGLGEDLALPVRVAHAGEGVLSGRLRLSLRGIEPLPMPKAEAAIQVDPGAVSEAAVLRWTPADRAGIAGVLDRVPRRIRLEAVLDDGEGVVLASNGWDLWLWPGAPDTPGVSAPSPSTSIERARSQGQTRGSTGVVGAGSAEAGSARAEDPEVRVLTALDLEALDFLEGGGRALLRAGPAKGSLKTSGIWYLKGAPWAPPHPLNARVPRDLLIDLQGFDLEQDFVLHGAHLMPHVDPILCFWDTHDIHEVNQWLFAADTRVGEGRLLVSALDPGTAAGQWLESEFLRHLRRGPEPERSLPPAMVQGLRATLTGEEIELATWRFRVDAEDQGWELGWQSGLEIGEGWRDMPASRHWEAEGVEHTGVAWYAVEVDIPAGWEGKSVHAVFEGVDDSYHLYCNGELVARHGDPGTGETVWLVRTTGDLTESLRYGEKNRLVLRVVDHAGAGGMHRRAFLSTGWVGAEAAVDLLN